MDAGGVFIGVTRSCDNCEWKMMKARMQEGFFREAPPPELFLPLWCIFVPPGGKKWPATPGEVEFWWTSSSFAWARNLELAGKKKKKRLNEGGRASYVLVLLILPRICSHRLALRCKKKKKKSSIWGKQINPSCSGSCLKAGQRWPGDSLIPPGAARLLELELGGTEQLLGSAS